MGDLPSAPGRAARTRDATAHVVLFRRGTLALYVAHRGDDDWLVGGPGWFDAYDEHFRQTSLARLLARDPTLSPILDLPVGWHAWRDTPVDSWIRTSIPVGPTFLVTYEVRPTEATSVTPDGSKVEGAIVNGWVRTYSDYLARRMVRREIEDAGWVIHEKLDEAIVYPCCLSDEALAFYRQAQFDGPVLAFYVHVPRARKRRKRGQEPAPKQPSP